MIFCSLIAASTLTSVWFIQPYLIEADIDVFWNGIVWAALNASLMVFAWFSEKIEHYLGEDLLLILITILPTIGFIFLALFSATAFLIPLFLLFYLTRALNSSFGKSYVQEYARPDARASILSIQSLLFRLIFAFFGPIAGIIATRYSLYHSFTATALFFGLTAIGALYFIKKARS
jgi:MFS family permease